MSSKKKKKKTCSLYVYHIITCSLFVFVFVCSKRSLIGEKLLHMVSIIWQSIPYLVLGARISQWSHLSKFAANILSDCPHSYLVLI